MKTKQINLYTIEELQELNEKAFEKAYNSYLENYTFHEIGEYLNSLNTILNYLNCDIIDYKIDFLNKSHCSVDIRENSINEFEDLEFKTEKHRIKYANRFFNDLLEENFKYGSFFNKSFINVNFKNSLIDIKNKKNWITTRKKYLSNKNTFNTEHTSNRWILTGSWTDDSIECTIKDYYKEFKKTTKFDFRDFVEDILSNWLKSLCEDYENSISQENFIEHCEANEYYFTENGELEQ